MDVVFAERCGKWKWKKSGDRVLLAAAPPGSEDGSQKGLDVKLSCHIIQCGCSLIGPSNVKIRSRRAIPFWRASYLRPVGWPDEEDLEQREFGGETEK